MLEEAIMTFKGSGRSVENALIVLPEGFNIQKPYYDKQPPNVDRSVLCELARISTACQCAFVAGLIIADESGVNPPDSSAYLIDGSYQKLLARKRKKDNAEVSGVYPDHCYAANYTACPSCEPTPVERRGLAVAALICLDAQSDGEDHENYVGRCDRVAKTLRGFGCKHSVMCIPAHMSNGFYGGQVGQKAALTESLEGTVHVLANSNTAWVGSCITNVNGIIVPPTIRGDQNRIEVFSFETLSTVHA
jgi:hypothetical protein